MRIHLAHPRWPIVAAALLLLLLATWLAVVTRPDERAAVPAPEPAAETERENIPLRERGLEFLDPRQELA